MERSMETLTEVWVQTLGRTDGKEGTRGRRRRKRQPRNTNVVVFPSCEARMLHSLLRTSMTDAMILFTDYDLITICRHLSHTQKLLRFIPSHWCSEHRGQMTRKGQSLPPYTCMTQNTNRYEAVSCNCNGTFIQASLNNSTLNNKMVFRHFRNRTRQRLRIWGDGMSNNKKPQL